MSKLTLNQETRLRALAIKALKLHNQIEKFEKEISKKKVYLPNELAINNHSFRLYSLLTTDSDQV